MSASNRNSVFLDVLMPIPIRSNKPSFPCRLTKLQKGPYYSQALSETDKALAAGVENHNHKHWSWEYAKSFKKDCLTLFPEDNKKDKVRPFSWLHRRNKSSPLVQVINADEVQDGKPAQNKYATSTPVSPLLMTPRVSLSPKSSSEGPVSGESSTPATTTSSKPSQRRSRFSFESGYDELVDGAEALTKLQASPIETPLKSFNHRHRQNVTFDSFLSPHKSGTGQAHRGASNALTERQSEVRAVKETKRLS